MRLAKLAPSHGQLAPHVGQVRPKRGLHFNCMLTHSDDESDIKNVIIY